MFYFNLGFRHITDLQGYDHMLFLLALTLPLSFSLWKPTLKWITAFTVGHSISLAIAAFRLGRIAGRLGGTGHCNDCSTYGVDSCIYGI